MRTLIILASIMSMALPTADAFARSKSSGGRNKFKSGTKGLGLCYQNAKNTKWDPSWTKTLMEHFDDRKQGACGSVIGEMNTPPKDLTEWCGIGEADARLLWANKVARAGFMSTFVKGVSKKESSHDPQVCGDGGDSVGLMQLSTTDKSNANYKSCDKCAGLTDRNLIDAHQNLGCSTRVVGYLVKKNNSLQGIKEYYGSFRSSAITKSIKSEMAPWCKQTVKALRSGNEQTIQQAAYNSK